MSNELENDPFDEMEEEDTTSEGPPTGQWAGVLGKWYVLYPLCAVVLCGAVYLGIRLQSWAAPTIRVTLATEPADVTVRVSMTPPRAESTYHPIGWVSVATL